MEKKTNQKVISSIEMIIALAACIYAGMKLLGFILELIF